MNNIPIAPKGWKVIKLSKDENIDDYRFVPKNKNDYENEELIEKESPFKKCKRCGEIE